MRDLTPLLYPQSIAVIGASSTPGKAGSTVMTLLSRYGYPGAVIPVNGRHSSIQGLEAYRSIEDIDTPIDLAVLAIPARQTVDAVNALARKGARAAILFASGFGEVGEDGKAMQGRLSEIAVANGFALVGPNCLGVISLVHPCIASFSPIALHGLPVLGNVAIVSQSGAFGAYALAMARQSGLGLSHWITTGNEADLQLAEVIEWLADDPHTSVIMAYIEGCRDGALLRRALSRAQAAGKPVVVTKVGTTEAGARSARSHTDSLAGEDSVYHAVFEDCGVIRARTVDEFFRFGCALARGRRTTNGNTVIVTVSGGVGVLMADRAVERELTLADIPESAANRLRQEFPFASAANPVDVTGQILSKPAVLGDILLELIAHEQIGCLALFLAGGLGAPGVWESLSAALESVERRNAPLAIAVCGLLDSSQRKWLEGLGCTVVADPSYAIDSLFALSRSRQIRERPGCDTGNSNSKAAAPIALPEGIDALDEAEALSLLASVGIRTPEHRIASSAKEAAEAVRVIGSNVAVKLLSRAVLHKSDVGGVRLNVGTPEAAAIAYGQIGEVVARAGLDCEVGRVIVAEMIQSRAELLFGVRRDAAFGLVVVIGLGGTAVELLGRVAIALLPLSRRAAVQIIERAGVDRLLRKWRGGPDLFDEAVDALLALSTLAESIGDRLDSIEINPMIVADSGLVAVDAVIALSSLPSAVAVSRPAAI